LELDETSSARPPAHRAPTADRSSIRRLAPDDLDAIVALLDRRDDVRHRPDAVRSYLCELDPARVMGWIATEQGRPAGMTVLYRRRVLWSDREVQAGYWAHLYVHDEFRHRLVYPRLVQTMMKEGRAAGLELIYTAMRRQAVADAHQGLGFRSLGHLDVRWKPLKPAALLARYRGWSALETLGAPADRLYGRVMATVTRRGRTGLRVEVADATSPFVTQLLGMSERQAATAVHQLWDVPGWRARFGCSLEGHPYTLLLAFAGSALVGGLLLRVAERSSEAGRKPVRIGVVLDLVADDPADGVVHALLAAAESRTLAENGHAMLWLDGVPVLSGLMARSGYRPSAETYRMIVWPAECLDESTWDLARWRFPFAEHDAF
jgi:hypothetical protein